MSYVWGALIALIAVKQGQMRKDIFKKIERRKYLYSKKIGGVILWDNAFGNGLVA